MAPDKISEESADSESSIDLEMESCCSPARQREDHRDLSLTSSPSSSPLSYAHDRDYEHQVISLVNNNLMNARYHSIAKGSPVVHDIDQVPYNSQCPFPPSNASVSVSNSNSRSSTTITPEPDFQPSVVTNDGGLTEPGEKISIFTNANSNSYPKAILNLSSIKSENVPRTVPCIVLSPQAIFSPTMYTSVSSPNSQPSVPLQLTKKQSFSTRDLIDDKKDNCVKKIDASNKKGDGSKKPLAFGIDRILSEEKTAKEHKDVISYPLPLAEDELSKVHRQHQHQHGNYLNLSQCSECFYLSRYCRSVQFPVATPAAAASASYSWVTTPSGYDASALMSPTGYPHHQHTSISASYNMSGNNNFTAMPSMVSCNTTGGGRRKRSWSRAVFSNLQRKGLEKRFQIQKYITKPDRRQLAATLGLTDAQVKVWFQNRRMKWRHSKEGKSCGGVGEDVMTSSSSANASATSLALYSSDKK